MCCDDRRKEVHTLREQNATLLNVKETGTELTLEHHNCSQNYEVSLNNHMPVTAIH